MIVCAGPECHHQGVARWKMKESLRSNQAGAPATFTDVKPQVASGELPLCNEIDENHKHQIL